VAAIGSAGWQARKPIGSALPTVPVQSTPA